MRWFAALLLCLIANVAFAQNPTCPTRPVGDNSNACASTSFVQSFLLGPANPPVQIGPTSYIAVGNYTGGVVNSLLFSARGTTASPITDLGATVVFQNTANVTGSGGSGANTLYASMHKRGTTASNDYHAAFFEMADDVGGASGAGIRSIATCNGGTGGNCTGVTAVGVATVPYAFLQGTEGQAFNNTGTDATTTFSAAKFATPLLSSCPGTNKCDAGFLINPNGTVQDISGFLVPPGTVTDTAFRNDASLVNGIDLTRGTYSGFAVKANGFTVGNVGQIAVNGAAGSTGQVLTSQGGAVNSFSSLRQIVPISNGSVGQAQATTNFLLTILFTNEAAIQAVCPISGTFKNLFLVASAPASGQTITATWRVNNTNTAVTCTITGTGTTCNDTTHTATCTQGQTYSLQSVTSATTGTINGIAGGIEFDNP